MLRRSYHWFSSLTALLLVLVGVLAESLHRPHLPGAAASCGHSAIAHSHPGPHSHPGHHHGDSDDYDHAVAAQEEQQSPSAGIDCELLSRDRRDGSHDDSDCLLCRFLARTTALLSQANALVVTLPVEQTDSVDDRPLPSRPRTAQYSRGPPSLS